MADRIRIVKMPSDMDGFYIISSMIDHKPIGFFGIKGNECVGFYIEEEYRNRGYAEETIKLIKNSFAVSFTTDTRNIPMQHLLEKLGYYRYFKYEVK
jgi:RimJ/RimL family protein N-acetyltransferase